MKNNIYKIIAEKKMTQGDLAGMVGVRREYMCRVINRKILPSVWLAIKIGKALKKPVEEVFLLEV